VSANAPAKYVPLDEVFPDKPQCRGHGCPFAHQCTVCDPRLRYATKCWGRRRKDGLWECRMYESKEQEPRA